MDNRTAILKSILESDPANALARYGLAMELVKLGHLEEGVTEFRTLVEHNPDHAYGYYQCGQALERLDRIAEARDAYTQGVAAAKRAGDQHARSEIQTALDLLG